MPPLPSAHNTSHKPDRREMFTGCGFRVVRDAGIFGVGFQIEETVLIRELRRRHGSHVPLSIHGRPLVHERTEAVRNGSNPAPRPHVGSVQV